MNWNQSQGQRSPSNGKVKQQWGKLTDDELTAMAAPREQHTNQFQQRYDDVKARATQRVDKFM